MKLTTPEISWHSKKPVLSVDFCKVGQTTKFASAGADNDVKIWSVNFSEDGNAKVEFLANLCRHNKAVNVVRFSPNEELLASAGDDSFVILWRLSVNQEPGAQALKDSDDDIENRESWTSTKVLRGHIEDVYDLAWSPDGSQLLSGSVDNSAIIWDVAKGVKLIILNDHKHYVQGVCWDPLGQYVVTNSSDRSCRLYSPQSYRCLYNVNKLSGTKHIKIPQGGELKQLKMFHDETMLSFFRRPAFTPDGSLLIVPAGRIEMSNQVLNTTYVFTRGSPNKPVLYLPNSKKPTVAARCCPILFNLKTKEGEKENDQDNVQSLFKIPYRMVFAIASLNSVALYDTQHSIPFGYISNIHYSGISDITWSNDGSVLVVSSTDGYCSLIKFQEGELGTPYKMTVKEVLSKPLTISPPVQVNSKPNTPAETSDSIGKPPLKQDLTPVVDMEVGEEPPVNEIDPKKKDAPIIEKFAVPVAQLPPSNTDSITANTVTARRVPLVAVTKPGEAAAQATAKQVTARHTGFRPVQNISEAVPICVMKPDQIQSGLISALSIKEVPFQANKTTQSAPEQSNQRKRRIQLVPAPSSTSGQTVVQSNTTPLQCQPLLSQKVAMATAPLQGVSDDVTAHINQITHKKMSNTGVGQQRRIQLVTVPSKQAVKPELVKESRRMPLTTVQPSAPTPPQPQQISYTQNVTLATPKPQNSELLTSKTTPAITSTMSAQTTANKDQERISSNQMKPKESSQDIMVSRKESPINSRAPQKTRNPIPLEPVVIILD